MNKQLGQAPQNYVPTHEEERLTIKHQLYPTIIANTLHDVNINDQDADELVDYIEYLVDNFATKMQQNLQLISVEQKKPHLLVN